MDALRLDVRYAIRSLLHRPAFSAIAVVTLALGIGVNTVAFSAINALLLRPFRVSDADRIGWVMLAGPGNPRGYATLAEVEALERGAPSFEGIAAEARIPVSVRTDKGAAQGWALLVTTNYLHGIRAEPAVGRLFTTADLTGAELPVVVSYRYWKEQLGAPDSLGGQRLVVNGRAFAVLGVLPDGHEGPGGLYAPDMWLPLARMEVLNLPQQQTSLPWLTMFARLRDDASRAQAEVELASVARELSAGAEGRQARIAKFYPMEDGHPDLAEIRPVAWIALAVVGIVLVIACFNVAALLMARVTERQKELGVRCAVGASRGRILRQLVTEGFLLAAVSGIASLVVASWSEQLLATFSLPSPIPQRLNLQVDGVVIAYTAVLVAIAGVLPAILPALQATRANLVRSIQSESGGGTRRSRTRNAFVVAQVAGSTLFMVSAILFVRSFINNATTDTGFDTKRTIVLQLSPGSHGYDEDRARILFDDLRARLTTLPGVRASSFADRVPFYVGYPSSEEYSHDGADCSTADCRRATVYAVGPDHFATLGIPLLSGRDFSPQDLGSGSGIVVSRHLADQLWPDGAVGRSLRVGAGGESATIIGVAADIKHRNMAERPGDYIYRPLRPGDYGRGLAVIARTTGDPATLMGAIREQVRALDPDLPAASIATMEERMRMPLWPSRTAAGFLTICALLAVVLGSIGLFGVMYFAVSQRTREFGIRSALGATRRRVITLVLTEGLRLTVPGVLLGAIGGYIAGRLLSRMLFGVSPADPLTFAATAAIELAVALLASALPAYRAMRVDPLTALRE
jgi:predicted permease